MNLTVRDEHCSSFKGLPPSDPLRLKAVSVCVMAHLRGDRTDAMRGSKRYDALWQARGAPPGAQRLRSARARRDYADAPERDAVAFTIGPHARGDARAALTRFPVMAARATCHSRVREALPFSAERLPMDDDDPFAYETEILGTSDDTTATCFSFGASWKSATGLSLPFPLFSDVRRV
jgi:hypothetical protein